MTNCLAQKSNGNKQNDEENSRSKCANNSTSNNGSSSSENDQKLQEIVPKIAELNVICREIGRDNVFYEPEIMTEVRTDGFMSQFSQVQRVYQRYFNNHAHPKIIGVALNYFP